MALSPFRFFNSIADHSKRAAQRSPRGRRGALAWVAVGGAAVWVAFGEPATPPPPAATPAPAAAAAAPAPVTPPAPTPSAPSAAPSAEARAKLVLFDGKTLRGWKIGDYTTQTKVTVEPAFQGDRPAIVVEKGDYLSGLTWADGTVLPRTNYELSLEAMKIEGDDFFCGLTFPVGEAATTLIVGGWGGMVVGLSNVDFMDASENVTTAGKTFAAQRWYRIRVRVTPEKVEAWIDQEKIIELETKGRTFSLRQGEIKYSLPLGLSAFQVRAAWRDLRLERW